MTCMAEFFGVPQTIRQPQRIPIRVNQGVIMEEDLTVNQNPQIPRVEMEQPRVEIPRNPPQVPREVDQGVIMVNRNQNADQLI